MAGLFPVFDVPGVLAEQKEHEQKYKPSPMFDIEKGDFVTDGGRRIIYGSGYDTWVLWCTKTIMTQRFAHMGYSSNIGIEGEEALAYGDRAAAQSAFERTVTEALLADPKGRTLYVRDFDFKWFDNSLYISCTVVGDNGNSATIKAKVAGSN